MKAVRTLVLLFLVFGFAPGCNKPQANVILQPPPAVPRAWIDAPLDGSTIPLEPYEVVFHIANLNGVNRGELSVNGAVIPSLKNPGGSEPLATLRHVWTPDRPGTYTLKVRSQSASGQWSDYSQAVVTVKGPTPTRNITPTPTRTPTNTPTPTLVISSAFGFTHEVSTSQFYYGGCAPGKATFSVVVSDPAAVKSVFLFTCPFRIPGKRPRVSLHPVGG